MPALGGNGNTTGSLVVQHGVEDALHYPPTVEPLGQPKRSECFVSLGLDPCDASVGGWGGSPDRILPFVARKKLLVLRDSIDAILMDSLT